MKAVILCDGDIPRPSKIYHELSDATLLIAADGGANRVKDLNITPNVIIGDLDSYTITGSETAIVIKDEDQETNDLEKALAYALENSVSDVLIIGGTGMRLDHTLKNLSVLLQFNPAFNSIVMLDDYAEIQIITSPFKAEYKIGTVISLFPLSGIVEGITTKGLKYPLNDEDLENGVRDGTSNETVEETIEITFNKGDLLLLSHH